MLLLVGPTVLSLQGCERPPQQTLARDGQRPVEIARSHKSIVVSRIHQLQRNSAFSFFSLVSFFFTIPPESI